MYIGMYMCACLKGRQNKCSNGTRANKNVVCVWQKEQKEKNMQAGKCFEKFKGRSFSRSCRQGRRRNAGHMHTQQLQ